MFAQKTAGRLLACLLAVNSLILPALAVTGTVNTAPSRLNLRSHPSTDASVLVKIPGGASVEVLDQNVGDGWYQISYQDKTGYVAGEFVDLIQTSEPVPQEIPSLDIFPREAPSQDIFDEEGEQPSEETQTETLSEELVLAAAPVAAIQEEEPVTGRVIAGSLNIRSAPSTTSSKVGSLPAGRSIEILEELDGWYRIAEGYVSADYVLIMDAEGSDIAQQVVELALSYVGYPYVYGGASPKGFDCSGFTSYIYKQFGISLNRTASSQLDNGTPVAMSELLPGDLVLFKKYANSSKRASHVGIYIGNGQFVHASTYGVGVIVSDLDYAYYTTGFVGGRRLV